MVSEALVETVLTVVLAVGAPLLVALFYAEGLIVGKLLQPPAVFIGYIAITMPTRTVLLAVCGSCVVAATLGQWTLYRGFNEEAPEFFGLRRRTPYLQNFPGHINERVGERKLGFVEGVFERYGAAGVCLLNVVPGIRGLTAIPAGLSEYPRGRFIAASTVGNSLYVVLLVAVARGLLEVAGLFG